MENKTLVERNAELNREIEQLQNDDVYLEEVARKKYGMLKENEMVYEYKPSRKRK
jgi:cell division protein FtsB